MTAASKPFHLSPTARRIVWLAMLLLATGVAAYAAAAIFSSSLRTPFVADLFANAPAAVLGHLAGGVIAILAGVFQVSSRMRARSLAVHRWLGRVYVVAVLVGGVSGFILALSSTGGLATHYGFGMMAVLWIGTTLMAWIRIRSGNRAAHRAWMFRSYALTLAAVTLRVYIPLSQMAGLPFDQFYQVVSWLCWVPNLLVAEWFVLSRPQSLFDRPLRFASHGRHPGLAPSPGAVLRRAALPVLEGDATVKVSPE